MLIEIKFYIIIYYSILFLRKYVIKKTLVVQITRSYKLNKNKGVSIGILYQYDNEIGTVKTISISVWLKLIGF